MFQFIHKQIPALKVELSKLKARVEYYSTLHTSYIARFETAKKKNKKALNQIILIFQEK